MGRVGKINVFLITVFSLGTFLFVLNSVANRNEETKEVSFVSFMWGATWVVVLWAFSRTKTLRLDLLTTPKSYVILRLEIGDSR